MKLFLYRTEERHQKRNTEINHETVEEGDDDQILSGGAGDDGQGSVHGSGTTRRDRGEATEPADHEGGTQQGDNFAGYVGEQGHCAQFGSLVFGDEDAG